MLTPPEVMLPATRSSVNAVPTLMTDCPPKVTFASWSGLQLEPEVWASRKSTLRPLRSATSRTVPR